MDAAAREEVYPLGFNTVLGNPSECCGFAADDKFVLDNKTWCAFPFVVV